MPGGQSSSSRRKSYPALSHAAAPRQKGQGPGHGEWRMGTDGGRGAQSNLSSHRRPGCGVQDAGLYRRWHDKLLLLALRIMGSRALPRHGASQPGQQVQGSSLRCLPT